MATAPQGQERWTQTPTPEGPTTDSHLVFSGSPVSLQSRRSPHYQPLPYELLPCRACGRKSRCVSRAVINNIDTLFVLLSCSRCGSLTYWPTPELDYSSHPDHPYGVRSYVELNASIDLVAASIMTIVNPDHSGRYLDIGCGYGFSLDLVRTIARWEVLGIEPSLYGQAGADALRVPIILDHLTSGHELTSKTFDVIHASHVIEHIAEPSDFLVMVRGMLPPDGTLILSTPDAAAVDEDISTNELVAVLSPGAHTILFTRSGLVHLLKRSGFRYVMLERQATSLLAFASNRPIRRRTASIDDIVITYLERAMARDYSDASLRIGLLYRAYRFYVERADYDKADRLWHQIDISFNLDYEQIHDFVSFGDMLPMCAPALAYFRGLHLLNHYADYTSAAATFQQACDLCAKKLEVYPKNAVVEADLIWWAKFHEALALDYAGELGKAASIYSQLVDPKLSSPVRVPDQVSKRARDQSARLP